MSRLPRFVIKDVPQHVIQRGNNREPCFFAEVEWKRIRAAVQSGDITGSERFRNEVETRLQIRLEKKQRGRPRKRKTKYEIKEQDQ